MVTRREGKFYAVAYTWNLGIGKLHRIWFAANELDIWDNSATAWGWDWFWEL